MRVTNIDSTHSRSLLHFVLYYCTEGSNSTVNCSSNNAPCELPTSTGPTAGHCYTLYCIIVQRDPTVQLTVVVTMQPAGYKHRQDPQKVIVTLCIALLYRGIQQEDHNNCTGIDRPLPRSCCLSCNRPDDELLINPKYSVSNSEIKIYFVSD